ncbi:MAG: DUF721 domain-containing protein [Flavobacteriia bacterium]|nr:DUF721 domain-containing protein [Flavobacteriia bacterium]OJX35259.1 MAG: hypothetical protein BGO87_10255 [Flavobacteriia bacterium 40-80]
MEENKRSSEFKPLGDLVDRLMKAYQLDGKLAEIDVLSKWEEMMGKAVAMRTRNIYIKDKVLILEIDSSVMREELMFGKKVIIQRINEASGKELITDVYFK